MDDHETQGKNGGRHRLLGDFAVRDPFPFCLSSTFDSIHESISVIGFVNRIGWTELTHLRSSFGSLCSASAPGNYSLRLSFSRGRGGKPKHSRRFVDEYFRNPGRSSVRHKYVEYRETDGKEDRLEEPKRRKSADGEGFEPTVALRLLRFSRPVH